MEEKLFNTIKKYHLIESRDKLVVGVSGGPDSICMLDFLYQHKEKLQIELLVAHINHGIREEAGLDERYVEEYCQKREIPFFCKQVQILEIAKEKKIGTEEAGRNIRYAFFEEVLEKTRKPKNCNCSYC